MHGRAPILFHQAYNDSILYKWVREKHVLDILWIDVEPVGKDDQVFLAPLEVEVPFLILITQIPGMVPTILKCCCRGLGILPVTQSDVRAMYEQFAIFGNANLLSRQRFADGVINMLVIRG